MKFFHLCLIVTCLLLPQLALAVAPKSGVENPGFYHFQLGAFEVTTITDGTLTMPVAKMLKGPPEKITVALKKNFLGPEVVGSVNAFLINTGTKLVLVDTGVGKLWGPATGHLLANLRAAGYKPEQIDAVVITHAHPDHLGGLSEDGKMVFPNAVVYIDKSDVDMVQDPKTFEKAPEEFRKFGEYAVANISPYMKAGKLKAFTGNAEIVPGVSSRASHGHSPGHNSYVVESGGQKLVLIGDLLHVGAVQFENPAIGMAYDADGVSADKQRLAAFNEAAQSGEWIGAAHLPFPGVGHLRKEKSGFVFVGVNWGGMPGVPAAGK